MQKGFRLYFLHKSFYRNIALSVYLGFTIKLTIKYRKYKAKMFVKLKSRKCNNNNIHIGTKKTQIKTHVVLRVT